jgi:hypothetical protein
VGTFDANLKTSRSVGLVRYDVIVGEPSTLADEADVMLSVSLSDVRNQSDITDYTGELQATTSLRITDRGNGGAADEAGTVQDTPLPATVPCSATVGDEGASCSLSTTIEALIPGAAVEGKRAIWELGQIEVNDGGADGVAATEGDNTLFAVQGVFVP